MHGESCFCPDCCRIAETESLAVRALKEANETLQDTVERYRRVNVILRKVNKKLRAQVAIAHENDEEFREMCQDGIYEYEADEGGFPASASS